jgi:hypothetical protein
MDPRGLGEREGVGCDEAIEEAEKWWEMSKTEVEGFAEAINADHSDHKYTIIGRLILSWKRNKPSLLD